MKAAAIVLFLTAQALCGNCRPQMTRKRQVQDCSLEEITRRIGAASCDPNYGQRIVDIYLNCNGNGNYTSNARRWVGSCSRNENGRFCYEFGTPQLLINYTQSLRLSCPNLYSYSNYECTDSCRVALQNFKTNVGCCLNSYYNISVYRSDFYNNAGLWSACSVSPPSFCQVSTLTLASVATSRTCSSVEISEQRITQTMCNPQVFQPILDIYKECDNPNYEFVIQLCGLNENNRLCAVVLNSSHPLAVESECQDYTQGCTRSCQTALNTFKTAYGCCVNFYNNSYIMDYVNTTNPALWSACGIPTPGFCTSTLLPQTTRSPSDSLPSTTRVPMLPSLPTSVSESNSALSLDFPYITMLPVLLVILNINMQLSKMEFVTAV